MGELIFANKARQGGRAAYQDAPIERALSFQVLEPDEFTALCWAVKAASAQLDATAREAAVCSSRSGHAATQETYVAMMLGPLAALDKLRRRLTGV